MTKIFFLHRMWNLVSVETNYAKYYIIAFYMKWCQYVEIFLWNVSCFNNKCSKWEMKKVFQNNSEIVYEGKDKRLFVYKYEKHRNFATDTIEW